VTDDVPCKLCGWPVDTRSRYSGEIVLAVRMTRDQGGPNKLGANPRSTGAWLCPACVSSDPMSRGEVLQQLSELCVIVGCLNPRHGANLCTAHDAVSNPWKD
jgi:hypothetical protein